MYWRQQAKQYWIKEDDKNTRFFHKYASCRKEHDKIRRLKDENGVWYDTDEGIQNLITGYFANIFTAKPTGEILSERITFTQVTELHKQALVAPITDEEVRTSILLGGTTHT